MTKVYVVYSYTWYDEYGESSYDEIEGVFTTRESAEKFVKEKQEKDGPNTKETGTDYSIVEQDLKE